MTIFDQQRYQKARNVTIVGAIVNTFLTILKIILGVIGRSQALVADGMHSLSDLATDIVVLIAAKFSHNHPDCEHPYGHGRIETIVTIVIAVVLLIVAAGIMVEAIETIIHHQFMRPTWIVLAAAFISIVLNEWIYRYSLNVGHEIRSILLVGNAWHHRSDALSSVIVLIGVGGEMLGIQYLDAIAAILVAFLIAYMAFKMSWDCIRELIDTGVDSETLQKITTQIRDINGVHSIHRLRTRLIGGNIFVDVHIQVNPELSVSEGHYIGEQIPKKLIEQIENVLDVTVHVDAGENELVTVNLPNREKIEKLLKQYWQTLPGYEKIQKMNLHYINGKIGIDLFLPLEILSESKNAKEIIKQYRLASKTITFIKNVKIFFSAE